ncbi:hypothetical protein GCM10010404_00230 [Nonomuraea africana]|uniref:Uncharacterized protein n=1 Tax=Nonomuraea africana TaxID=46171 RepID=A0ABR9KC57_9ACTN|nr:hypothetical protein [Nonomuraea africana]MBE1559596.1 hypothetical protein [Nonomuraea africana]
MVVFKIKEGEITGSQTLVMTVSSDRHALTSRRSGWHSPEAGRWQPRRQREQRLTFQAVSGPHNAPPTAPSPAPA